MLYCATLPIEMFLLDIQTSVLLRLRITGGSGLEVARNLCQLYDTLANRLMMEQPRKEKSSFLYPSYAGLSVSGHSLGCTLSKIFSNARSSFNDCHILCYIGYHAIIIFSVLSCFIRIY